MAVIHDTIKAIVLEKKLGPYDFVKNLRVYAGGARAARLGPFQPQRRRRCRMECRLRRLAQRVTQRGRQAGS